MRRRVPPPGGRMGGLSLVELLISTTLGLVLISGTIAVFAANRKSSELNAAIADMQDGARFALSALASDIRMSGFQGCIDPGVGRISVAAKDSPTADLRASAVSGALVTTATDWTPAPPAGFTPLDGHRAVPGTHALALQFGNAKTSALAARMTSPADTLQLLDDIAIETGDLAIVANCDFGDLFRVSTASADGRTLEHAATDNASGNLTRAYGGARTLAQTRVMRFESNIYFIGETGVTNGDGSPVRALYRQSLPYAAANPPTVIVDGVENLRIAFGVRAGTTLRYVTPDATDFDPSDVETVRIGLLMSSFDPVSEQDDTRRYTLAGQTIGAAGEAAEPDTHPVDRRYRLAFDTTVKVRNRRSGS